MKTNLSEDIAFFNLLKGLIAPKLGNESLEYEISIEDLANKMEMDNQIISNFLKKLQGEGLIDILNGVDDTVNIHFEKTHDKLLEIISLDALDRKIASMSDFIDKKISYFDFEESNIYIPKYAKEAKILIEKNGINANLSDIISRGLEETLNDEKNITRINKIIFNIAKDADEDDLKRLEEIIYYNLNLPNTENPFYVTLFLTALSYHLQKINNK